MSRAAQAPAVTSEELAKELARIQLALAADRDLGQAAKDLEALAGAIEAWHAKEPKAPSTLRLDTAVQRARVLRLLGRLAEAMAAAQGALEAVDPAEVRDPGTAAGQAFGELQAAFDEIAD